MATLEERLRLVVEATTGSAEAGFQRLTSDAERTATAADTAAGSVAAAADRVAQARAREADAAGKLAVAEAKLTEARNRYGADSSQVVAAEERVASAQRQVQLASSGTTNALEAQERAQRQATDAADDSVRANDDAGRATGQLNERVRGLRDTVVGLVAGVSLADWLRDSVTGYLEGSRGASGLGQAMNATTEEGGRLLAVVSSLGLEMDDLLEIQAEFASQVAADDTLLASFGARLISNENGTTNWALTLQDALTQLQKIPDATQRNALGFRIFGEEGYKQLSRLLLSGRSVEEAFEAVGTPFTDDDVESARRFDEAMLELSTSAGGLGREVGSVLVPILTGLVSGLETVGDLIGAIPGPIGIAALAALGLGVANRFAGEGATLLSATSAAVSGAMARLTGSVAAASVGTGVLATTMGVARVAGAGLMTMLGGPLGVALLAVGAGFAIFNSLLGDNSDESGEAAAAQEALTQALRESNGVVTESVRQAAARAAQERDLIAQARLAGVAEGDVTDAILGNAAAHRRVSEALRARGDDPDVMGNERVAANNAADALDELVDSTETTAEESAELAGELEQTSDKAALAEAAMDALKAALDGANPSAAELGRLAGEAARAQDAEAQASDRATAAIEAYRATTTQAVEATLQFIEAQFSVENANFAFLNAVDAAKGATDDATTSIDEQREAQVKLMEAALSAAGASADAAVENAEAAGQVVDDIAEAQIRADAMLADLRGKLNTPGLTAGAREELQGIIDRLQTARDNGDIEAVLTLTGANAVEGELDETTEDRETTVTVESRGGPAVIRYLDSITEAARLALIRVESRNGPAVESYIDGLARERLVILRLETRGGPAIERYLDDLTGARDVRVNVTRGTGAPGLGGPGFAGILGAPALATTAGRVTVNATLDLELTGRADRAQLSAAERGRARVEEIRAYEARNGSGWRRT